MTSDPYVGTIVCDLDGVVYLEETPVVGAALAITAIRDVGWRMVFATNNATRTVDQLIENLWSRSRIAASPDEIVSSAMAAASVVASGPVFVVGESGLSNAMHEAGFDTTHDASAATTVAVGLDREFSYDKLAAAVGAVIGGAAFVAANHDPLYPTPHGPRPGGGALAASIAAATGVTPLYAGKPHKPMRDLIEARAASAGPIWMVGDRPDTDIALAQRGGWRSVLVLTGIVTDAADIPPGFAPDVVLSSIASLPEQLGI